MIKIKEEGKMLTRKDIDYGRALNELRRMSSELNLPEDVQEQVSSLYEQALGKGYIKGRSMEAVIGSLIYALSRESGSPRLMSEICDTCGVDKRNLGRTYRYIARKLSFRVIPSTAVDYLPRCVGLLGVNEKIQKRAEKYLKQLKQDEGFSGKGPIGLAAATLYIATLMEGEFIPQRKIAEAIGVTEVTIRNRCQDVAKALEIEDKVEKTAKELSSAYKEQQKAARFSY